MRDTKVVVKTCKEYDIELISTLLKDGFDTLGGLSSFVKSNQTVLIKPDLYYSTEPNLAKTTNPNIISALAELVDKAGAKCIIADSPKGDFSQSTIDKAYVKTQMLQSSNNGHAILSTNEHISILTNPAGENCRDIYVMDAVNDADVIINVAKFRCDKNLGLVGCAQNLFGLIPGKVKDLVKARCHTLKSFFNYNIDLYETLENKVIINIMDGIVACEANNDPRILNTLLIGQNPYSIDATALTIINQDPTNNIMLNESERRNKFTFDYELAGDDIEPLKCMDFNYNTQVENIRPGSKNSFKRNYNRHQKRPIIPSKLCKGCKVCVGACPMGAIKMQSSALGDHAVIDSNKCINCFKCLQDCPYKVITSKTPIKYSMVDKSVQKSLRKK